MEMFDYIEKFLNKQEKQTLLSILGEEFKGTKKIIIERILKKLIEDKESFNEFYDRYKEELALSWKETEETLGCNKKERLEWTKNELIEVSYYNEIHQYGTIMDIPKYDLVNVFESKDKVSQWRKDSKILKEKQSIAS